MSAVVIALTGRRIIFLGANTPIKEIESSTKRNKAEFLALSISKNYKKATAETYLRKIRSELALKHKIIVGGDGAPETVKDVTRINNFNYLLEWLNPKSNMESL